MDFAEAKTVADFLVADFETEMRTTLSVIESVPNGALDYRPESKSKAVSTRHQAPIWCLNLWRTCVTT